MKTPTIGTKTWCIGNAELKDYEVIRSIRTSLKWSSYLARDKEGNRVTLSYMEKDRMVERYKFLLYQNGVDPDESATEATRLANKYLEEVKESVERIKGLSSTHVAGTLGFYQDHERDQLVIVSEYTPGIELDYITDRIAPRQQIFLFAQILEGLAFIHDNGFLHLNIKPSHVFVDVEAIPPVARLDSFGLAVPKRGYTGEYGGTPLYIAPEVILKKRELIDERADLYSLGATFYFCLTARQPLEQRLLAEANKERLTGIIEREIPVHAPPSHYCKEVPPELDQIIMGFLEKEPEKRGFSNASEALNSFRAKWPEETSTMVPEGTSTLVEMK